MEEIGVFLSLIIGLKLLSIAAEFILARATQTDAPRRLEVLTSNGPSSAP